MTLTQLQRLITQAATGQKLFVARCGPADTLTEHDGEEVETPHGTYRLSVISPKAALVELQE